MKLPQPLNDVQDTLLALIQNRSLTSIELRQITRSSYPPARINDVESLGISIIPTSEKYINRRGKVSNIARYTLATPLEMAKKIYVNSVKK